jgi:hypothetical protein
LADLKFWRDGVPLPGGQGGRSPPCPKALLVISKKIVIKILNIPIIIKKKKKTITKEIRSKIFFGRIKGHCNLIEKFKQIFVNLKNKQLGMQMYIVK